MGLPSIAFPKTLQHYDPWRCLAVLVQVSVVVAVVVVVVVVVQVV
jgi:hypothetical protein